MTFAALAAGRQRGVLQPVTGSQRAGEIFSPVNRRVMDRTTGKRLNHAASDKMSR